MHSMRLLVCVFSAVVLGSACSGPGPTPAEYADRQLTGGPEPQPTVRERLNRETSVALRALRDGKLEEALDRAEQVLRSNPRAGLARAIRGRVLAARATRSNPSDLPVMERAEGEILLALKVDPRNPEIQLLHSEFLELDGQVTLAATVLDGLLESRPGHVGALRAASRLRFELGQERVARPLLIRLLEATPKDAAAVFRLAHCRVRLAEAVARGDTPSRLKNPKEAARKSYLGAAQTFRDYQALRDRDVDGYLGEVHALFLAAQLLPVASASKSATEIQHALSILDRAEAVDAKAPGTAHSRGAILEHLGRHAEARNAYEAAIARDDKFLPSILNMAQLLDATGDKKTARVYCQRALELGVSSSERRRLQLYLDQAKR